MLPRIGWPILYLYTTFTLYSLAHSSFTGVSDILDSVTYDASSHSDSDSLVRVRRQSFTDGLNAQLGVTTTGRPATTPITSIVNADTTEYYDINYISPENGGRDYWIELDPSDATVIRHKSLQNAYRLAVKINVGFSFLFYGHNVEHVTIATGGFVYMSHFLHSFLTASQYIAPLMANFDTSLGKNESEILFTTNDKAFIVQWTNVYLKDKPDLGKFTFQVQLHRFEGKIVAAYRNIPAPIANVSSSAHPVKIGLSDAYYWDVGQYRTIYPYHTYNASADKVKSHSAIIYTHKKTCNMIKSGCDECLNTTLENFQCYWCSALQRCSDAYDRQRQEWMLSGCVFNVTQTDCHMMFSTPTPPKDEDPQLRRNSFAGPQTWKAVTAALCTIFALAAASILGAVVYGYRNPQSTLGQFLVRNRPSELWRKFKAWKDKDENNPTGMSQI